MAITINDLQNAVRDRLNCDPWMIEHGVAWLAENQLDIEFEITKHIGNQGIVGIVMTPALSYQGMADDYTVSYKVNELVLQVTETPILNRGRLNAGTALDACARAVAQLMKPYRFVMAPKGINQAEVKAFLVAKATLQTAMICAAPTAESETMETVEEDPI